MPMRVIPADIEAIEEPLRAAHERDFEYAGELVSRWGVAWPELVDEIARFQVAAPSWALGAGGTRFASFPIAGEPRTTEEKIDDIAVLHALTGANGSVSLHVPWDDPPDPSALARYAAELGLRFDAMNSNTFQDNPSTTRGGEISYKFGSMCHTDPRVRQLAVEHNKAVVEMGIALGSTAITVWLADGTNHPGQASLRGQFDRVAGCLKELHDFLPTDWAVFIEHKPYEPAFYATVNVSPIVRSMPKTPTCCAPTSSAMPLAVTGWMRPDAVTCCAWWSAHSLRTRSITRPVPSMPRGTVMPWKPNCCLQI